MAMQSEEDLTRVYVKYFTIRLVQAVIQSRSGYKVITEGSALKAEDTDWFNLRMEELGEVTSEIRRITNGRFPPMIESLCIEFYLTISDTDSMVPLEIWCVSFDRTQCNENIGVRSHLYHQMATLLKSAIAASRATPTYRFYARKQTVDTFVICYRIRPVSPDLALFGVDNCRTILLGSLPGPCGTLNLTLYFSTELPPLQMDSTQSRIITSTKSGQEQETLQSCLTALKPVDCGYRHNTATPPTSPPFGETSPVEGCFSTFSTSPASLDVPWFGAAGGSSPAEKALLSKQHLQQQGQSERSESGSDASSTCIHSGSGITPKQKCRSNSSGMFKMDMSNEDKGQPSQQLLTSIKCSSSAPTEESPLQQRQRRSSSDSTTTATISTRKATFPFSSLLCESVSECRIVPVVRPRRAETIADLRRSSNVFGTRKGINFVATTIREELNEAKGNNGDNNHNGTESETTKPQLDVADNDDDDGDSSDDSFVKVPSTLFIDSDNPVVDELGDFVRQCKIAPSKLRSFEQPGRPDNADQQEHSYSSSDRKQRQSSLENLPDEIKQFAYQAPSFDQFVSSINAACDESDEDAA